MLAPESGHPPCLDEALCGPKGWTVSADKREWPSVPSDPGDVTSCNEQTRLCAEPNGEAHEDVFWKRGGRARAGSRALSTALTSWPLSQGTMLVFPHVPLDPQLTVQSWASLISLDVPPAPLPGSGPRGARALWAPVGCGQRKVLVGKAKTGRAWARPQAPGCLPLVVGLASSPGPFYCHVVPLARSSLESSDTVLGCQLGTPQCPQRPPLNCRPCLVCVPSTSPWLAPGETPHRAVKRPAGLTGPALGCSRHPGFGLQPPDGDRAFPLFSARFVPRRFKSSRKRIAQQTSIL